MKALFLRAKPVRLNHLKNLKAFSYLKIPAILLLLFASLSSNAQNSANLGKEFYVVFGENYEYGSALSVRYVVTKPCNITAQYADGTYLDNNVSYQPGVYTKWVDKAKVQIPTAISVANRKNLVKTPGVIFKDKKNLFLKVTSTEDIALYAMNMIAYSTDGTCILPTTALGTEYTLISSPGFFQTMYVMASQANTTFTIRNRSNVVLASETLSTAGEGFVYWMTSPFLNSENNGCLYWPDDFTGYTVEADKPVAVFDFPLIATNVSAGAGDHVFEQMWPRNTAGRNYFVWDLSSDTLWLRHAGAWVIPQDRIRVIGTQDYTTITITGPAYQVTLGNPLTTASYPTTTPYPSNVTVHARGWAEFALSKDTVYKDNSPNPVKITADKPVIVSRVLGTAPALMWTAPVEQRITSTVIAPYSYAGSVIKKQYMHVMIPAGSQDNMTVKETWNDGDSIAFINLRFYTNTVDPNYVIAYKQYNTNDNVMIEMSNPAGMIAYMTGEGSFESYGYSAGAGALDLQVAYFMIHTKTPPHSAIFYKNTTAEMHSFQDGDLITVQRMIEKTFTNITWKVNGTTYAGAVENLAVPSHSLTIPASLLNMGENTISMSVRFTGATLDSVYTGKVWRSIPPTARDDRMTIFSCASKTAGVLANDLNATGSSLTIARQGSRGTATVVGGTAIHYEHDHAACESHGGRYDTVKYSICSMAGCDTAMLRVEILRRPAISLHDSCSRKPYLSLNYQYHAAVYEWFVSSDGVNWEPTPVATGPKLYVTESAWYKVAITYKGDIVETRKAHFVVNRKAQLQGNLWWYIASLVDY